MRESVVHDTTRGQAAFDELQRLYDRGDIQIGINVVQYNRSGSVFYRAWTTTSRIILPILGITSLTMCSRVVSMAHPRSHDYRF